jgi:hypothetical protein
MRSGVQGSSASSWISRVHASWLSSSAVTFRASSAFPTRRAEAARAASDARVARRSPPTAVAGTSRSTPRQDCPARRPQWWPGRTLSRSVALQPRQHLLRQPRAETPSAHLLGCAITASARMRSVAIRCGPSMSAHARSLVACTTSERMECRARRGTSHGLFHRLLRPPVVHSPPE